MVEQKGTKLSKPSSLQTSKLTALSSVEGPVPVPCHLTDLCPEDKQKVASLIRQVVELGEHKKGLEEQQAAEAAKHKEVLDQLRERNKELVKENGGLKARMMQMLAVLRLYQHKVQVLDAAVKAKHMESGGQSAAASTRAVPQLLAPPADQVEQPAHGASSSPDSSADSLNRSTGPPEAAVGLPSGNSNKTAEFKGMPSILGALEALRQKTSLYNSNVNSTSPDNEAHMHIQPQLTVSHPQASQFETPIATTAGQAEQQRTSASPVIVSPNGELANAVSSLLSWQTSHGLGPSAMAQPEGKVLQFDPAVGLHGAFYLLDIKDAAAASSESDSQMVDSPSDVGSELTLNSCVTSQRMPRRPAPPLITIPVQTQQYELRPQPSAQRGDQHERVAQWAAMHQQLAVPAQQQPLSLQLSDSPRGASSYSHHGLAMEEADDAGEITPQRVPVYVHLERGAWAAHSGQAAGQQPHASSSQGQAAVMPQSRAVPEHPGLFAERSRSRQTQDSGLGSRGREADGLSAGQSLHQAVVVRVRGERPGVNHQRDVVRPTPAPQPARPKQQAGAQQRQGELRGLGQSPSKRDALSRERRGHCSDQQTAGPTTFQHGRGGVSLTDFDDALMDLVADLEGLDPEDGMEPAGSCSGSSQLHGAAPHNVAAQVVPRVSRASWLTADVYQESDLLLTILQQE